MATDPIGSWVEQDECPGLYDYSTKYVLAAFLSEEEVCLLNFKN